MAETRGSRVDQREVTCTIEGVDTGIWDKFAGGGKKATSSKHRRGGMGDSFSLGGPGDYDNVTLTRDFDLTRDLPLDAFLDAQAGNGDALITEQYLDRKKGTKGKAVTWAGTIIEYNPPDADSTASGVAEVSIVIEITARNSGQ